MPRPDSSTAFRPASRRSTAKCTARRSCLRRRRGVAKQLFNAVNELPSIKQKADWALAYIDENKPFAMQLLLRVRRGIHFSSSFAFVFYLKTLGSCRADLFKRTHQPGQGLHTDCRVVYTITSRTSWTKRRHAIVQEPSSVKRRLWTAAFPTCCSA